MPYSNAIKSGVQFILRSQNVDGGIPVHESSDSAAWPTAEALEALLTWDGFDFDLPIIGHILAMGRYLCESFTFIDDKKGCWYSLEHKAPSIMATGHAIKSLFLLREKLRSAESKTMHLYVTGVEYNISDFRTNIDRCINAAKEYILENLQADNGFCDNPNKIVASSITCSYYALSGLIQTGLNYDNNGIIKQVCWFIIQTLKDLLVNNKSRSKKADIEFIANLAYGFLALERSKCFSDNTYDNFRNKILTKILGNYKRFYSSYTRIINDDSDFVYFLPHVVLQLMFCSNKYTNVSETHKLIDHFLIEQDSKGAWSIHRNKPGCASVEEATWVTAEAIIALNIAQSKMVRYEYLIKQPRLRRRLISLLISQGLTLSTLILIIFLPKIIPQTSVISSGRIAETVISIIGAVTTLYSFFTILEGWIIREK